MRDTIIFTLLALEGICIIGLTSKIDDLTKTKPYEKGFEDAINIMVKLYDITGSQVCDLFGKIEDGVDVEILDEEEKSHDYN